MVLSSDDESAKNESSIICMGEKDETVLSGYDDDTDGTDEFDAEETEKVLELGNSNQLNNNAYHNHIKGKT